MVDFINSWKKGNKQIWMGDISLRFGRITLLQIRWNFKGKYVRLMFLNFGVEFTF